MIRQAAVAGQFYSRDPGTLRKEIQEYLKPDISPERVIGIVVPHAGYLYSGEVAGEVYSHVEMPGTVVILGPNHRGFGAGTAIFPSGEWLTPLGSTKINDQLAELIKSSGLAEEDTAAHRFEHSIEVQLPFLQYINPELTIVPISLGYSNAEECSALGSAIARAISRYGDQVLIVASSDMSHYESVSAAKKKDELALREIMALNPVGLLATCRDIGITMCGVIPTATMLVAARELGATRAKLVRYATSGEVTGDNEQVVAYAGLTIS